MVVENSKIL